MTALGAPQRARLGLGRAFQLTNLFPALSVFENVRLATQAAVGVHYELTRPWTLRRALIERAGELAEFVLVDLPAQISPMHRAVVAASDFVAVLLEPDPLSVEFAKETIKMLDRCRVDTTARGLVVINRAPLSNSIRPQEVKSRTGCDVVGVVPSAGEACVMAFGVSKLLFTAQPESRFSLAIQEIADSLVQNPVGILNL